MKQQRLDGLADGIFAIVMTLLAFDLKAPVVQIAAGMQARDVDLLLQSELIKLWPAFMSLLISFALLFTYWRAHHFLASVYARNLTISFANRNALFFFLIVLVPFSSQFLGLYPTSQFAIAIYGLNVIAIGFTLYFMRRHVEQNPEIETMVITKADYRSGYIRILFPVFSAAIAIIVSYWNTRVSMLFFTLAILFNLLPASSNIVHRWLDLVFTDEDDVLEGNYEGHNGSLLHDDGYVCVPRSALFSHAQESTHILHDEEAHMSLELSKAKPKKKRTSTSTRKKSVSKKVIPEADF